MVGACRHTLLASDHQYDGARAPPHLDGAACEEGGRAFLPQSVAKMHEAMLEAMLETTIEARRQGPAAVVRA